MQNRIGTFILRLFCQRPSEVPACEDDTEWSLDTALDILKKNDPDFLSRIQGKVILDFGSGMGFQSIALLKAGAARVVGVDLRKSQVAHAREILAKEGLSSQGNFFDSVDLLAGEKFDLVISQDAMEHYSNPETVLEQMRAFLKPEGQVLITFGPPWYAPYGAHMQFFTKLPWIQLVFSERTIMAVRSLYRADGAKFFHEVPGGLNRMSVHQFELLISHAGLVLRKKHYHCVRGMNFLAEVPILRELFINHATVLLAAR